MWKTTCGPKDAVWGQNVKRWPETSKKPTEDWYDRGKKKKKFVKVKGKGPGLTRFGSQAESGVCQLFEE